MNLKHAATLLQLGLSLTKDVSINRSFKPLVDKLHIYNINLIT